MNPTKTCNRCHQDKPLDAFTENEEMTDGHIGTCKPCILERARERDMNKQSVEGLLRRFLTMPVIQ